MKEWLTKLIDGNQDELENDEDYLYRLGLSDDEDTDECPRDASSGIFTTLPPLDGADRFRELYLNNRYHDEWLQEYNNTTLPPLQRRREPVERVNVRIERIVEPTNISDFNYDQTGSAIFTPEYHMAYKVDDKVFDNQEDAHAYVLERKYPESLDDIDPHLDTERNTEMIFDFIRYRIADACMRQRTRGYNNLSFLLLANSILTVYQNNGYIDAYRFDNSPETFGYELGLRRGDKVINFKIDDMI